MTPPLVVCRLPAWVVNGITVTLGLALVQYSIGLVAGAQAAQTAIATAVCASLADVVTTVDRVARRVLMAVIASTAAATLFLAVRPHEAWLIPVVGLIVFGAMLVQSWGPKAGSVSFAAGLSLVFAMSLSASDSLSWERFGWGLAGSAGYWIWAVLTARLLQPTWRNFALAATAQDLSTLLTAIGRQIGRPADMAWQSDIFDAEAALAERLQAARDLVFDNDQGLAARHETAILLQLIDLRDLALASNLEAGRIPAQPALLRQAELTGQVVEQIAASLRAIALRLRSGDDNGKGDQEFEHSRIEQSIEQLLAELAATAAGANAEAVVGVSNLLRNKLQVLHSLQRLLEPGSEATLPSERSDLRRYITPDEWSPRAVASNLRLDAPVFRHALRTCATATAAYALARHLPWMPYPQWILLTIMAVMQGSLALTLMRRNARVLGTLAGCLVALLLTTLSSATPFLAVAFLLAAGIAHAFFGVRYSVTAGAAAVMALLQAHLAAPELGFGAFQRVGDTIAGAVLGWAATYALPTWERRNLPASLRQAVAAIRAYAAEATLLREADSGWPRFARQRAYDAIRTLAAIRSRSLAEPADVRVPIAQLTAWLAAAYGLMAQLSNLRLSLTLHGRLQQTPEFAAAVAGMARELDALLAASAMSELAPTQRQAPRLAGESALAAVPHLLPRVRRTLEEATRVTVQAAQIEGLAAAKPLA